MEMLVFTVVFYCRMKKEMNKEMNIKIVLPSIKFVYMFS